MLIPFPLRGALLLLVLGTAEASAATEDSSVEEASSTPSPRPSALSEGNSSEQDSPASEAGSPPEQAQRRDAPLTVEWSGPPECGPPSALEKEASRLLGKLAATAGVRVVGTARRLNAERYRVELLLSGNVSGARSLESSDCREAIQAAAVVLALAINPDALLSPEPEPTSEPPRAAEEPTEQPAKGPVSSPEKGSILRLVLGVGGRLTSGLTPFPAWGATAMAGLEWTRLRFEIYGAVQPTSALELEPEGKVSFRSGAAGLRVCGRFLEISRVSARACAAGAWNSISALPTELNEETVQRASIFSAEFGATLALQLHPHLRAALGGAVQAPTTRPRFTVAEPGGDGQIAHEVAPGGVGTLGMEFLF